MTFEQIGQQLRTARDTLGLSLGQIQERTKIPFNHLQSIDNGRVEDLPEPVYVSGFIKRYAECVGLDGQRLSDEYKQFVEANNNPNGRFSFFPKPQKETAHIATAPAPVYYKSTKLAQPAPNVLKSLPFYLFWVVVVLSLVTYLVSRQQTNEAGQQDPSVAALRATTDRMANMPPPTVTTSTGAANEAPVAEAPTHTDARIALTASQHVWVEVKAISSGDTVFTGFLERGDRKDFQDAQGIRVRAGNGGSLTVEQDGKSQTLGEPGKKIEKAFVAKDFNQNAASTTAAATDAKTGATKPGAGATTATTKKPTVAKKPTTPKPLHRLDGMGSHRDIPGEGGNSIDVPYRY
jgi:cytoskeletal protein RodZ